MFCNKLGINVNHVISAASSKPYGFMPFYPSVGVGGHCIPVDPIYLANKARNIGHDPKFIDLAAKVNDEMPIYHADRAEQMLGTLKGKRVLVVGVTYKPNVADVRETPVKELINSLIAKGAQVDWHDELVKSWEGRLSVELNPNYDLAILATKHDYIDLKRLGDLQILDTMTSI
jgi:UDP-N-acetyl-D-glucosamine dehydrogenase